MEAVVATSEVNEHREESVDWRHTIELWTFGLAKVPLILYVRPRVRVVCKDRYSISIGLSRRTGNQVGSMYFGAITMGAEMTPSAHALVIARSMGKRASFVTRQVRGEFLAPAKGEVTFLTANGAEIEAALRRSIETGNRAHANVQVVAFCERSDQPVARFEIELSVKASGSVKAIPLHPYTTP